MFTQDDVRQRFVAAYKARMDAGHIHNNDYGMWIVLDTDTRRIAASVGSGIADHHKPIAVYSLDSLLLSEVNENQAETESGGGDNAQRSSDPTTIAEVMQWARERLAEIAGVHVDAVRLELRLES